MTGKGQVPTTRVPQAPMGDCAVRSRSQASAGVRSCVPASSPGASLPVAVATRSAGASSPQRRPEATSASSAASGQTRRLTVADYVVERLAALGIARCARRPGAPGRDRLPR